MSCLTPREPAGGGALRVLESDATISHALLINNRADNGRGGALYAVGDADGEVDNQMTLSHVTVVGNQALNGGAAFVLYPHLTMEIDHVIVAFNEATDAVGGVWAEYLADAIFSNSNVYGNNPSDLKGEYVEFSAGDGNTTVDPQLMTFSLNLDPAQWDLHLRPDSSLIDAGTADCMDDDGSICDIGYHGGVGGDVSYYADSDADGLFDGWESAHGLSVSEDDAANDPDGDGLSNADEQANGCDPQSADTDGDGRTDSMELKEGFDPLDPEG